MNDAPELDALSMGGRRPAQPAEAGRVTEEWREIEQHVQPRLSDGYTAVRVSKPGFWLVKGPGPATALHQPAAPTDTALVEAYRKVSLAYEELRDTVRGECPSILDEDSGASQYLLNAVLEAEAALASRATPPDAPVKGAVTVERAAQIAECTFDDRPRSRVGHPSHTDWEDGYRDGTRAAAAALRALAGGRDE